jgi:capsule polysaccharide export protein KpsC/LpsZ
MPQTKFLFFTEIKNQNSIFFTIRKKIEERFKHYLYQLNPNDAQVKAIFSQIDTFFEQNERHKQRNGQLHLHGFKH